MPSITPDQQFHKNFKKNLSILESARKEINSSINDALRRDDDHSLKIYTNLYLLIYTSWTEALLVKLVHTPSGFSDDEKSKILKDKNILNKWDKCLNTAFKKIIKSGSEIPNKKKKIKKLIDNYIRTQANIRNKIAHGQWEYPLYSKNMSHDPEILIYMKSIDVIQIDTWFEIFSEISEIIRGLIDSREKNNHLAHYNQYYNKLVNIQTIIDKRKGWNIEEKRRKLKLKPRGK
jgi:hypothetical protein